MNEHFLDGTIENLKPRLKEYLEQVTFKTTGGGYACLFCKSGHRTGGTGALKIYSKGTRAKCQSCGANVDIFGAYGQMNGLNEEDKEDFKTIVKGLCDTLGEYYPNGQGTDTEQRKNSERTGKRRETTEKPEPIKEEPEVNYRDYFLKAHEHIKETDYPQRRGLSDEIIDRFKLGYDTEYRHPKSPKMQPSPRLIIATSPYSFLARYTGEGKFTFNGEDRSKDKVGKVHIFNSWSIGTAKQPVFIVEGEIDALSIMEAGGLAIGLGSMSNYNRLKETLEKIPSKQPFIICLDNEKEEEKRQRVEQNARKIEEVLDGLHLNHYRQDINGQYKDANEHLVKDREGFKTLVKDIIGKVEQMEQERTAAEQAEPVKELTEEERQAEELAKRQMENGRKSNAAFIDEFVGHIGASAETPSQSTGFKCLDTAFDGGFYEGLYTIGAISSLGKTAFVLQICDQMAKMGTHILFFSLEMARLELMARSISRESFLKADETHNAKNAQDVRHIMNGKFVMEYTEEQAAIFESALNSYKEYASNIYIQEGIADISVEMIEKTVTAHIQEHGVKPIVVIDYLQILDASKEDKKNHATDKQIVDHNITALKRLSRDKKLTIIGISSFNRENYTEPVNYASFKESGAIEYSTDVLIGLQYKGMDYKTHKNRSGEEVTESTTQHTARVKKLTIENNKAAFRGEPVKIEIKILKNRNGFKSTPVIDYYPKYNTFTEVYLNCKIDDMMEEEPEELEEEETEEELKPKKKRGHKY